MSKTPVFKMTSVTPEDLSFALEVGDRAAKRTIPVDPTQRSATILNDDGSEDMTLSFTDMPFNRAMIAIRDAFQDKEGDYFMALMARIQALSSAVSWTMSVPYLERNADGEVIGFSDVLLRAAAACPLSARSMRFDKIKFQRALKEAAK